MTPEQCPCCDTDIATPEQIARRKREALAAMAMARQKRTAKEST